MQIEFTKTAAKGLRKAPKHVAAAILDKLADIARTGADSSRHDVVRLSGRDGYRLRVGAWRAIFTADGTVLMVLNIAPRGEIYKR